MEMTEASKHTTTHGNFTVLTSVKIVSILIVFLKIKNKN